MLKFINDKLASMTVFGPFALTALKLQCAMHRAFPRTFPKTRDAHKGAYEILISDEQRIALYDVLKDVHCEGTVLEYWPEMLRDLPIDDPECDQLNGFCL